MDGYDKYEEACKEIRVSNEILLKDFEEWLKLFGLTGKTINRHVSNINFFINEFLLYEEAIEAKNGISDVSMFLGYWFIKKAMWASESSLRNNATSIKKFYVYMYENGLINIEELDDLKEVIKEEMPEWLDSLEIYDDPSIGSVW